MCCPHASEETSVRKCETTTWFTEGALQPNRPPAGRRLLSDLSPGSRHVFVRRGGGTFSLLVFLAQPLRWIVTDIPHISHPLHMEINGPSLQYMLVYEIASTVGLCVGIIVLLYSYCIVTPVRVTKSTSAHPAAADFADEGLRFYFLERKNEAKRRRRRRRRGGWRNGNSHKHGNVNKPQPLGFCHPPIRLCRSASAYTSSELCYLSSHLFLFLSCFICSPRDLLNAAGSCWGQRPRPSPQGSHHHTVALYPLQSAFIFTSSSSIALFLFLRDIAVCMSAQKAAQHITHSIHSYIMNYETMNSFYIYPFSSATLSFCSPLIRFLFPASEKNRIAFCLVVMTFQANPPGF